MLKCRRCPKTTSGTTFEGLSAEPETGGARERKPETRRAKFAWKIRDTSYVISTDILTQRCYYGENISEKKNFHCVEPKRLLVKSFVKKVTIRIAESIQNSI